MCYWLVDGVCRCVEVVVTSISCRLDLNKGQIGKICMSYRDMDPCLNPGQRTLDRVQGLNKLELCQNVHLELFILFCRGFLGCGAGCSGHCCCSGSHACRDRQTYVGKASVNDCMTCHASIEQGRTGVHAWDPENKPLHAPESASAHIKDPPTNCFFACIRHSNAQPAGTRGSNSRILRSQREAANDKGRQGPDAPG